MMEIIAIVIGSCIATVIFVLIIEFADRLSDWLYVITLKINGKDKALEDLYDMYNTHRCWATYSTKDIPNIKDDRYKLYVLNNCMLDVIRRRTYRYIFYAEKGQKV